jgi:hypothetical protein
MGMQVLPDAAKPAAQIGLVTDVQSTELSVGIAGSSPQVALSIEIVVPMLMSLSVATTSKHPAGYGTGPGPGSSAALDPHRKVNVWGRPITLIASAGEALVTQFVGRPSGVGVIVGVAGLAVGVMVGVGVPLGVPVGVAVDVGVGVGVSTALEGRQGTGPI